MSTATAINIVVGPQATEGASIRGFVMPAEIPMLPAPAGERELLSHKQEINVGYRLHMLTLRMLGAMAADTRVIEHLAASIIQALGPGGNPERAVSMVQVDGRWIRVGSIPNDQFALLVRDKVRVIQARIAEVRADSAGRFEEDLFSLGAHQHLKEAVCELIPYDYLLNSACTEFKTRCEDLNQRCRALVRFVAAELRMPPRAVHRAVCGHWSSPTLFASIATSGGYEFSLYPAKARKGFREQVIAHQQAIVDCVASADVTVAVMLNSWDDFWLSNRSRNECMEFFAKANAGLVEKAVMEYRFADSTLVRSAAQAGLVRAIQRFAPEMGCKFSTLAVTWIRQSILRDLEQQNMIRLPEGSHALVVKLGNALREKPGASYEHLASVTGIGIDDVTALMYFVNNRRAVSLDSALSVHGDESEDLHEHIRDENNNFVDEVIEDNAASYVLKAIAEVLTERELEILVNRYGLGGAEPRTLAEMAQKIGRSVERVRQIESMAIQKILRSGHAEALKELI